MTNKEKLKKAMENEFNKNEYYKNIIRKIEGGKSLKKNSLLKWAVVPVCLVVIVGGILFLNFSNDKKMVFENKPYVDEANNVTLNINEAKENVGSFKIDADIKVVTDNDLNFPLPYKSADIPNDLDKSYKYIYYGRKDKESKEYDILVNYKIGYDNGKERSIQVAYAKGNKPVRDYYFSDEGSKVTNINGVNLKIYKFENIYFTEFQFNGYNFDIETSGITEQELSKFLLSILK